MPLRLYNSGDWRDPSEVRVYNNNEFKNVKIAYVYDLGTWRVVFPEASPPIVNVIDPGSWQEVNTVDRFYVQMIVNTSELSSMVGELYAGSAATGTPIQTAEFDYSFILEGYEYYIRFYVPTAGTYTIKATATSITEQSLSVVSNPITPIGLSVSITSASVTATSYSVTWSAVGQEEYIVYVLPVTQGQAQSDTFEQGVSTTKRSASGGIVPPLAGGTQYNLYVGIRRAGNFLYVNSQPFTFTTPSGQNPQITNFSATATCNSITATWTNNADVDTGIISISEAEFFDQGNPIYGNRIDFNFVAPQNSKSFLNLLPLNYYNSATAGYYRIDIFGRSSNNTTTITQSIYINTLTWSPPSAPTGVFVNSSFYGNDATVNWTGSATNCASVNGYQIQYKTTSQTTWTNLVTTNSSARSYSFSSSSVTLTANTTYDLRIRARSDAGDSPWTQIQFITSNTPYTTNITTSPSSPTTFSSVTINAQLINISGGNAIETGKSLTFSVPNSNFGTFSNGLTQISAVTNSSGLASVTFNTNQSTTSSLTFTVSGSSLQSSSRTVSVGLSPGLVPSLSVSNRNPFGADIAHSNYNSSWSYSSSVSSPGFVWPGQTAASSLFLVYVQTRNNTLPDASQDANYAYCTSGGWTFAPVLTVTVTSSRTGYQNGTASISGPGGTTQSVQPSGGFSQNYTYTWYYYDGSAYQIWGTGNASNNGRISKDTSFYRNNVKGRTILCKVEATRNYSGTLYGANTADSDKITGS